MDTIISKISHNSTKDSIFNAINISILQGEYIWNGLKEQLNELKAKNNTEIGKSADLTNLIEIYIEFCNYYQERLNKFNHNEYTSVEYLDIFYPQIIQLFSFFEAANITVISTQVELIDKENYLISISNLLIAYIDEELVCNEQFLSFMKRLIQIFNKEINKSKDIVQIIKQKAEFLKVKIELRNKRSVENYNFNLSPTMIGFENNAYYKAFYQKLYDYYESRQLNNYDTLYEKLLYSHCSKSFDDETIKTLNDLLNQINIKLDNNCSVFDKIAYDQAINVIYRKKLSLQLSSQDIIRDLKSKLSAQENKLFETPFDFESILNINKFITDEKYLKFPILEFIDKTIHKLDKNSLLLFDSMKFPDNLSLKDWIDNFINPLREIIRENFKLALSKYKIILEKYDHYNKLPIYLTFTESQFIYQLDLNQDTYIKNSNLLKTNEINLYLNSSCILPNNYINFEVKKNKMEFEFDSKLEDMISKLEIVISNKIMEAVNKNAEEKIKTQIDLAGYELNKTKKEFDDKVLAAKDTLSTQVSETKKEFDDKVKNNEWKLVQIAAMFVTIATFVLINVKIFEGKTMGQSASIMFGLAACFTLFNFFFKVLNNSEWGRGDWILLGLICGFIIISLVFYFKSSDAVQEEINKLKDIRLSDSILLDQKLETINNKVIRIDYLMKRDTVN